MSKERFLLIAVIFLLVLNGGVIAYLIVGRNAPPRPPQLFEIITERLHFDEKQKNEFFALRDQHRDAMDKLDAQFESTLQSYLQLLSEDSPSASVKDSLENVMASVEKLKAATTLQHFQQVKNVCSAEQKREFNNLIPELMHVLMPPKNNNPPPRRH